MNHYQCWLTMKRVLPKRNNNNKKKKELWHWIVFESDQTQMQCKWVQIISKITSLIMRKQAKPSDSPVRPCVFVFLKLFCLITFVSGKGWGCPAKASLTVVSQMWGSWSPRAVTMNWTGSDRLATSCSVYTVPSGLTLKLGSLLTKPTSLLRWQSSNFTREADRESERGTELESSTVRFTPWGVRKSLTHLAGLRLTHIHQDISWNISSLLLSLLIPCFHVFGKTNCLSVPEPEFVGRGEGSGT